MCMVLNKLNDQALCMINYLFFPPVSLPKAGKFSIFKGKTKHFLCTCHSRCINYIMAVVIPNPGGNNSFSFISSQFCKIL